MTVAVAAFRSRAMISFEPWRGAVVNELDHQQIMELYDMREVLEGAAARLAARTACLRMLLEESTP